MQSVPLCPPPLLAPTKLKLDTMQYHNQSINHTFANTGGVDPHYNEHVGLIQITLICRVSCYITGLKAIKKKRKVDQQNYLVITRFHSTVLTVFKFFQDHSCPLT